MANGGKLREPEARDLALQIAASFPGHEASTTQIKAEAPKHRAMSADDLKPSQSRGNETMWEQIMGNVVSHQKTSTSIFNRGLSTRTKDGIRVTEKGLEYLKNKGLL